MAKAHPHTQRATSMFSLTPPASTAPFKHRLHASRAAMPIASIATKGGSGKWICKCGKDLGSDPLKWSETHVRQHKGSREHK